MTRLAGALPKGEANGLGPIVQQLISIPHQVHVVIALVDCKSTKVDHDSGDLEPTVRVRRIEAVLREDMKRAEQILNRAFDHRSGATVLPFEMENDLRAAFGMVNLSTGEIVDDEPGGDPS